MKLTYPNTPAGRRAKAWLSGYGSEFESGMYILWADVQGQDYEWEDEEVDIELGFGRVPVTFGDGHKKQTKYSAAAYLSVCGEKISLTDGQPGSLLIVKIASQTALMADSRDDVGDFWEWQRMLFGAILKQAATIQEVLEREIELLVDDMEAEAETRKKLILFK
jgi:hypothetical protein